MNACVGFGVWWVMSCDGCGCSWCWCWCCCVLLGIVFGCYSLCNPLQGDLRVSCRLLDSVMSKDSSRRRGAMRIVRSSNFWRMLAILSMYECVSVLNCSTCCITFSCSSRRFLILSRRLHMFSIDLVTSCNTFAMLPVEVMELVVWLVGFGTTEYPYPRTTEAHELAGDVLYPLTDDVAISK